MTYQEWKECVDPKVAGTWNLHEVLGSQREAVDFFLLFSSISGIMGQIGQANYNAANTYLDALVRHRHQQGLPASVIDIGVMGGIGVVAETAHMEAMARAAGYYVLGEQDLLDAITASLSAPGGRGGGDDSSSDSGSGQLVLGLWSDKSLADPTTHVLWKRDARMAFAHSFTRNSSRLVSRSSPGDADDDNDEAAALVRMARTAPDQLRQDATIERICRAIGQAIADLFVYQAGGGSGGMLPPTTLLDDVGLDSMNAVELQAWLAQHFGVDFPMFDLIHTSTMWDLAATVADLMYEDAVNGS